MLSSVVKRLAGDQANAAPAAAARVHGALRWFPLVMSSLVRGWSVFIWGGRGNFSPEKKPGRPAGQTAPVKQLVDGIIAAISVREDRQSEHVALLAATEDECESTKAEQGGGGRLGDGGALHKNLFESNMPIGIAIRVGDVKADATGNDRANGVLGILERIPGDAANGGPIAIHGRVPAGIQRLKLVIYSNVL